MNKFLLLSFALLTACNQDVLVLPPPSPLPTPVESPLPVVTPTPVPSPTPVVTPTPTPKPPVVTPTPTPKPTPTPAPTAEIRDRSCDGLVLDPMPQRDEAGWTLLPPLASRVIFVSKDFVGKAPEGNNFYVTKVAEASALLRRGQPDQVLFKRGETYSLAGGFPQEKLGGADSRRPMVIAAYGSGPRPVLNLADGVYLINATGAVSNMMIQSLDVRSQRVSGTADGIRYTGKGGKNWLIEDMRFQAFRNNLSIDSQFDDAGNGIKNLVVRRSQLVDAYSVTGDEHSQNVYLDRARGVVFEQNVFDHGGWKNRGVNPGKATKFNHNLYIQTLNKCVTFRENVSMRGSATGLQMRAGGIVEDNFFMENPMQLSYGLVNGGSVEAGHISLGISGRVQRNVFLNGTDVGPAAEDLRTGNIEISNVLEAIFSENLMAHHLRGADAGYGVALKGTMGVGISTLTVSNNVIYDLGHKLNVEGKAWGSVVVKKDGSVFKNGVMVIPAAASGIPASAADTPISGSGVTLKGNIFQTGMADFQNLAFENPDLKVVQKQTSPVRFKDPNRKPEGFKDLGSREAFLTVMRDRSFDPAFSAKAINAWVKAGFQIVP